MSDTSQRKEIGTSDGRQHIERELLGESIGGLSSHIKRKQALADETRYAIVYIVYRYGEITHKHLRTVMSTSSDLEEHLKPILNCNLIARVSSDRVTDKKSTYYRITKLGEQNITADIRNITGEVTSIEKEELQDPYLAEIRD